MIRYLFDTNHASEFMKAGLALPGEIKKRSGDEFGFCSPVVAELWFMVHNSHRIEQNRRELSELLTRFRVWPLDNAAGEIFGRVKVELRKVGRIVADVDLQIASVALANDLVLLTADGAFGNVPGLRHENWLV